MSRPSWISFWRRLAAVIFAVLALCFAASPALADDPPGRVGRVALVEGNVSWLDAGSGNWVPAELNQPITSGDRLQTEPGARAELQVGSSIWRLDGSTEIEVLRLDDDALRVQVQQGSLALSVRAADAARETEVVATAGRFLPQQPGRYRVDEHGDTSAGSAWEGRLRFEGGGRSVLLEAGQRAEFWLDGNQRDAFSATERDDFAAWVAAADQERRPSASARYVSPEMTGVDDLDRYGQWEDNAEYGALWAPRVVDTGWAPYRHGRWAWVRPWGWTWVDEAPWGFAPFHYGRWVQLGSRWCWAPGRYVARPVYAPALVGWVGGGHGGVSISIGARPSGGWFPLAPREVYVPRYRVSPRYVRNINITHVTHIDNITTIIQRPDRFDRDRHYRNRDVPGAVTEVPITRVTRHDPPRDRGAPDRAHDAPRDPRREPPRPGHPGPDRGEPADRDTHAVQDLPKPREPRQPREPGQLHEPRQPREPRDPPPARVPDVPDVPDVPRVAVPRPAPPHEAAPREPVVREPRVVQEPRAPREPAAREPRVVQEPPVRAAPVPVPRPVPRPVAQSSERESQDARRAQHDAEHLARQNERREQRIRDRADRRAEAQQSDRRPAVRDRQPAP